jgi:hypothetical protein
VELKSAYSAEIVPDTCVPTVTVSTGCMVPVAVTLVEIAPVAGDSVVSTAGFSLFLKKKYQARPITTMAEMTTMIIFLGFMIYNLIGTPM